MDQEKNIVQRTLFNLIKVLGRTMNTMANQVNRYGFHEDAQGLGLNCLETSDAMGLGVLQNH
jgi:hypothetical protein